MNQWILYLLMEVLISPELTCSIQNGLNPNNKWDASKCEMITDLVNKSDEPDAALAIQILESRMREGAEGRFYENAVDLGLMQLHCKLGRDNRCKNGLLKGMTIEEVKDPSTNIRLALILITEKKKMHGRKWMAGYNGSLNSSRYVKAVKATIRAIHGKKVNYSGPQSQLIKKVRSIVVDKGVSCEPTS